MPTPRILLKYLFPNGTRGKKRRSILKYPRWPIDLFGAVAYLLQASDRYTHILCRTLDDLSPERVLKLKNIGKEWRTTGKLKYSSDKYVQNKWRIIVNEEAKLNDDNNGNGWEIASICLLIISDEAAEGVGFQNISKEGEGRVTKNSWIQMVYYLMNVSLISKDLFLDQDNNLWWYNTLTEWVDKKEGNEKASYIAASESACILIPPEIMCVQPKTKTPSVGCTLRSLSHHLSLLPGSGQVRTKWVNKYITDRDETFNILFVPYPYEILESDFKDVTDDDGCLSGGYFDIEQNWLVDDQHPGNRGMCIVERLESLIEAAECLNHRVDMVIFSELSLDERKYEEIVEMIKGRDRDNVQIIVAGVKGSGNGMTENCAKSTLFIKKSEFINSSQKKHHRWKINKSQIEDYSIGKALAPDTNWWEKINISRREIEFVVFRHGSCYATLICEDLARVDPCQAAIRSIGPNLVFALLMDGPQILKRWPERYALTLSDDPGCSVLTVTSLGLVNRSNAKYKSDKKAVALWKDSEHGAREIVLPNDKDALLLKLVGKNCTEVTIDGRSDSGTTVTWELCEVVDI